MLRSRFLSRCLSVALSLCPAGMVAAQTTIQTTIQTTLSVPARTFVESLGVNTHLEYTDGRYADAQRVLKDLQFLGVSYVRNGIPQSIEHQGLGLGLESWDTLAKAGVRFNVPIPGDADLPLQMEQIRIELKRHPGMVASVEGPNEINNAPVHYAGLTGDEAARALQRAIYTAVHSEPMLRGVPVYYFTGGSPVDLAQSPGLADFANAHPYPHFGEQPSTWLAKEFRDYFEASETTPKVITETGYYTDPTSRDWGGVDAPTQAKLLVNTWFDAVQQGISRTFLYQLLDPYAPTQPQGVGADAKLGLFYLDDTPKPAALAIARLTKLLADRPSRPQAIPMMLEGMPETGHSLVLTRADGSILVALWNEVSIWDTKSMKSLATQPVKVRLLVRGREALQLFDPVNDTRESFTKASGGEVSVEVPDHVVLIVFAPQHS
ncbi:hypothetical protein FTO74_17865 [Granulicella sp. WH15]|uniref:hypothetical protein n=1 Tax=Granulicella sp. WH15 TaxID=2602070 RepID=UPI0013668AAE|nr:hypothetical protein [Granulicella sp. WH15]QHN05013.1 hypothetical protein FTO74_17865 [Granulicella sp. WH15]